MTAVETLLAELVAESSGDSVDVAHLLCDRHPPPLVRLGRLSAAAILPPGATAQFRAGVLA